MIKLRTKIEIMCTVILLLMISIAQVLSVTRTISNTQDTVTTFITNSNGKYWDASNSNIQSAVWDLNSTNGGWIQIPTGAILITKTIQLIDHLWIKGYGNATVLQLDDNANTSIFTNVDKTSGNTDIKISDMTLDGNGETCGIYPASAPTTRANTIYFKCVDRVTIQNCHITKSPAASIFWWFVNDSKVRDCELSYSGIQFEGTGQNNHIPKGVFTEGCVNMIFDNLHIHDCFAAGFSPEAHFGGGTLNSSNWILSNSIIHNCHDGIYLERTENGMISNCVIYDNNKDEAYADEYPDGVTIGRYVTNITISNCITYGNGNDSAGGGSGFACGSSQNCDNILFSNCISYDNYEHGFVCHGHDIIISGCTARNNTKCGIYGQGLNLSITNNNIVTCGDCGIWILSDVGTENKGGIISGNKIRNTTDDAIRVGAANYTITDNNIYWCEANGTHVIYNRYIINNNWIVNCSYDGIYVEGLSTDKTRAHNGTINSNYIDICGYNGIQITHAQNFSVMCNVIKNCGNKAFSETGASSAHNIFILNNYIGGTIFTVSARLNLTGDSWNLYE